LGWSSFIDIRLGKVRFETKIEVLNASPRIYWNLTFMEIKIFSRKRLEQGGPPVFSLELFILGSVSWAWCSASPSDESSEESPVNGTDRIWLAR